MSKKYSLFSILFLISIISIQAAYADIEYSFQFGSNGNDNDELNNPTDVVVKSNGKNIYVEKGKKDIPSNIMASLDDYKTRHPHIDFEDDDYEIILNLGEYNSRLMMSLMHYKLKTRYLPILSGGSLIVPPTKSFADKASGKHTLRFGLRGVSIKDAHSRCKSLIARNLHCKVEIFPTYMKQAKSHISDDTLSQSSY